jgi:hypothetical protein
MSGQRNRLFVKRISAIATVAVMLFPVFTVSACFSSVNHFDDIKMAYEDTAFDVANNGGKHVEFDRVLYVVRSDGIYAVQLGTYTLKQIVKGDILKYIFIVNDTLYFAERLAGETAALCKTNLDGTGKTTLASGNIDRFYAVEQGVFYSETQFDEGGASKYSIKIVDSTGENAKTIFEETLIDKNRECLFLQYGAYLFISTPGGGFQRADLDGNNIKSINESAVREDGTDNPFLVYNDYIYMLQTGADEVRLAEGDLSGEEWTYYSLPETESLGDWTVHSREFYYTERGADKGLHRIPLPMPPDDPENTNIIKGDVVDFSVVQSEIYVDITDAYDTNAVLSEIYSMSRTGSGTIKYKRPLFSE